MPNDLWVVEATDDYKLAQNQVQLQSFPKLFVGCLEDHPRIRKWLITMVIVSPLNGGIKTTY